MAASHHHNLPTGDARISPTAYATASAWAHYGFAEAERMDSRRGRLMLAALRLGTTVLSPMLPALAPGSDILYWRHRWFSDWVDAQQPALAIEIGAGLSTRGQAYARAHPNVRWVDLDLPGMVAQRQRRHRGTVLPQNYQLAVGDLLSTDFADDIAAPSELKSASTSRATTIAITEGVMDYLDRPAKQRAWAAIVRLLRRCGGGRYLCEIYPLSHFAPRGRWLAPAARVIKQLADRPRSSLWFDADDALAGLVAAGFSSARVLEEHELADAAQGPAAAQRAFCLLEART